MAAKRDLERASQARGVPRIKETMRAAVQLVRLQGDAEGFAVGQFRGQGLRRGAMRMTGTASSRSKGFYAG